MYPNLQYFIEKAFHSNAPGWTAYINTFGFFVAIAFLIAAWVLTIELKRKETLKLLHPELLPYTKARKFLPKAIRQNYISPSVSVYPHQRVGEIVILALISGLVGAKIFNALESWNEFKADPIGNLMSGSGLTFYGGLIAAAIAIWFYCKKHKIHFRHFCDAIAPALMLAYGIGRLGCHFSGDGDWGVFNSAYITTTGGSIKKATPIEFDRVLQNSSTYFVSNFGAIENVPRRYTVAPNWVPKSLLAVNFGNNVNDEGVVIIGCSGKYCHILPVPVFPTSLYEASICIVLFAFLWSIRRKQKFVRELFGIYLILNGLERFFIEKIKVNYRYDWGFVHPAQSEVIAILLLGLGIGILIFSRRKIIAAF